MKNFIYLFLAVTIFSCSSDSDESSNTSSVEGRWNIVSVYSYILQSDSNSGQDDNGNNNYLSEGYYIDLEETCANENYFICNDNSGTMFFHFNEDTNGSIIDCFQSSSDNFSYTNSEDSFTQFVFTPESGGQLIAELSDDRNNLTFNGNNTQAIYTFTRE